MRKSGRYRHCAEPRAGTRSSTYAGRWGKGGEFAGEAMGVWAPTHGILLDFVWTSKPAENSHIVGLICRMQHDPLNVHTCCTFEGARLKLEQWRQEHNLVASREGSSICTGKSANSLPERQNPNGFRRCACETAGGPCSPLED